MKTCQQCGYADNRDTARFCAECGLPIGDDAQTIQITGWLKVGSLFQDRYRVVRILGVGGMGAVYLVEDQQLYGKQWALKELVVNHNSPDYGEAMLLFRQESQMLARLSNPHLPEVVGAFSQENREYLLMDYVEGETLADVLARYPQGVPPEMVQPWAEQLCDALYYLHSQNPPVIFRDLKPSNVMITPNNWVMLIDFGIARLFSPGKSRDTVEMGTTGYAPPEQHGRGQTDPRSDVYGLGATLHHLLSGRDPGLQPFIFPPLGPNVPEPMRHAVEKAVAMDPAQRFPDMRQFKQTLVGGSITPTAPMAAAAAQPPQKRRWWVWAVVLVLVLFGLLSAAGVVSLAVNRSTAPPPTDTRPAGASTATRDQAVATNQAESTSAARLARQTATAEVATSEAARAKEEATAEAIAATRAAATAAARQATDEAARQPTATNTRAIQSQPTVTRPPTAQPSATPRPTSASQPTSPPAPPPPPQTDVRTELLASMKQVQADMQSLGGQIDQALTVGYIDCSKFVSKYDRIANAPTYDVSGEDAETRAANDSYRRSITTLVNGVREMAENCRTPGGSIPRSQWGPARQTVNQALDILNPAVERFERSF